MIHHLGPLDEKSPPYGVTAVVLDKWATTVQFVCQYEDGQQYLLSYHKCTSIEWSVHALEDIDENYVDVIAIEPGLPGYEKAALLVTSIFEALILYDYVEVIKME